MCQNRHISDALLNIKTTRRRVVHALPSFAAAAPSIKHTNAPRAVSLAPTRTRARVCDFRCARVLEGEATGSLIALGGYFVVCAARGGPFFPDGTLETPAIVRNFIIRCSNARRPLITRSILGFRTIIRSLLTFSFLVILKIRLIISNCEWRIFGCVARAAKRARVALFPPEEDNSLSLSLSLSPQMFTSISWRIFEEARSKRVWSISSTFEYALPFPPRAALSFFPFPFPLLPHSLSFSLSLCFSGST